LYGVALRSQEFPGMDTLRTSLSVESKPPGATVFVDDSLIGVTPCRWSNIPYGRHIVRIGKTGYAPQSDSVIFKYGVHHRSQFVLLRFGALRVFSEPDGALVLIDGVLAGPTPFEKFDMSPGIHDVEVQSPEHHPYKQKLVLTERDTAIIRTVLVSAFGNLTLEVSPPDSRVFLDSVLVSQGSLQERKISSGKHMLTVDHPFAPGPLEREIYVGPGSSLRLRARMGMSQAVVTLPSMLVPGAAQLEDGSRLEAGILGGGFWGSLGTYVVVRVAAWSALHKYHGAEDLYRSAQTEALALQRHKDMDALYPRWYATVRDVAVGTAIVCFVANAIDVALNHPWTWTMRRKYNTLEAAAAAGVGGRPTDSNNASAATYEIQIPF
ncbi:MAG TPA: PEGA domain-containing protein, partial [Bacteroidota bacterium]|nr:PEGA domain-containing protein [Bacteroidota bacterium]